MSQYNNIFISRDDFLDYKAKGIPYTGFVIGEGYAFVQYQNYAYSGGYPFSISGDIRSVPS